MLAYIFWHRPFPHVEAALYEEAIRRFQRDLAREAPPGFIRAASFRIDPVPWLGDEPGYEDWCLLQGSWAMDPLNAYAVAGRMKAPHDHVAAQMAMGHGGLYAHVWGETAPDERSMLYWLTRPRGIDWRAALDEVRTAHPQANVWRRQMVLGPAAEFAVEMPADHALEVPPGWQARAVQRARLPAA